MNQSIDVEFPEIELTPILDEEAINESLKGKDVKICSANIFGNALNTDHKGVKCCLDIR